MGISYHENRWIDQQTLTDLYRDVGWKAYYDHPDKMARLLDGALWHLSAWQGEELLGLIRCVGDDCSILYIQDLLVKTAWQRRGIGSQLMQRTLSHFSHIRQTVLLTQDEEGTRAFYEAQGLVMVNRMDILGYTRIDPLL